MKFKETTIWLKGKLTRKIAAITAIASALMVSGMIEFSAAVNFSGGVEQVTNRVISQGKKVAALIFGALAVAALAFTAFKAIKALLAYKSGREFEGGPIIGGGIATLVCGFASATTFFGWFGL